MMRTRTDQCLNRRLTFWVQAQDVIDYIVGYLVGDLIVPFTDRL